MNSYLVPISLIGRSAGDYPDEEDLPFPNALVGVISRDDWNRFVNLTIVSFFNGELAPPESVDPNIGWKRGGRRKILRRPYLFLCLPLAPMLCCILGLGWQTEVQIQTRAYLEAFCEIESKRLAASGCKVRVRMCRKPKKSDPRKTISGIYFEWESAASIEAAAAPLAVAVEAPVVNVAGDGGLGASTADELIKLKALLDSGVLTRKEFDAEKTKVLRSSSAMAA